ncbi:uncharacterized protein IL334_005185 [Kwoniella shivajii]|uniref:F-box domain-containing protein n=1 Tax=Kwoniella shivajii TaxID=564305 RepID=A0ABZ1D484_9TREE|nr:hypothetical protein IL334_005185 [Kwoniella shivajii]
MLSPPLYCSICSAPCLLPRLPLPNPYMASGSSYSSSASGINAEYDPEEWLSAWYCLRLSSGLTDPLPFLFSSMEPSSLPIPLPLGIASSQVKVKSGRRIDPPRRIIPIHSYCVSIIRSTTRKSLNNSKTHEEGVLLSWSLPRWTGHGPWSNQAEDKAFAVPEGLKDRKGKKEPVVMTPGYWGGMFDMRERFARNGNHLLEDDLISPLTISKPTLIMSTFNDILLNNQVRPEQSSLMTKLPLPILNRIFHFLLDDTPLPSLASCRETERKADTTPILDPISINSFQSVSFTCSELYYISLPSSIWVMLILDSVKSFRNSCLQRWRANPTGVGSASQLWSALEESFDNPIRDAICLAWTDRGEIEQEHGWEMKDVWYWWNYDKSWKNRRRVWRCAIWATATARDADWW